MQNKEDDDHSVANQAAPAAWIKILEQKAKTFERNKQHFEDLTRKLLVLFKSMSPITDPGRNDNNNTVSKDTTTKAMIKQTKKQHNDNDNIAEQPLPSRRLQCT